MNGLLPEILQQIFREILIDSKDGFSVLMVNRTWCKMIIPMIWEDPYIITHRFNHYKVIRTLLSTLDNDSRSLLINNNIDLSSSPSGTLFDYSSFIRNISYDYLYKGIKNYICLDYEDESFNINVDSVDSVDSVDKVDSVDYSVDEIRDFKIKKIRLMFQTLCSLIINKSESIKTIRRFHRNGANTKDLDEIEEEINKIPYLPGANKSLQELYGILISGTTNFTKFQIGLTQICKNMTLIKINCESIESSNSLASLIKSQTNLKVLMIEFSKENLFVPILESLENHNESLEYLSLKRCDFNIISDKALEIFISCKKLEILCLNSCIGLDSRKFLPLSTSFPLLSKFTFKFKDYYLLENFFIGIIKTSNRNLRKFSLDSFTPKIVETILKYSTEFTSCELGRDQFSSVEELSERYVEFQTKTKFNNNHNNNNYNNDNNNDNNNNNNNNNEQHNRNNENCHKNINFFETGFVNLIR